MSIMKISEIEQLISELIGETLTEEGFGYVSAKDRKKDPKSIPGEHWRVKFQSAGDLKKHGDTEVSSVNEIRAVIKELINEMWADLGNDTGDEASEPVKPTGRITDPGSDGPLVDLYKSGGKSSDVGSLPSVGGAMSENEKFSLGKEHDKSQMPGVNVKIPTFDTMNSQFGYHNAPMMSFKDEDALDSPQKKLWNKVVDHAIDYLKMGNKEAKEFANKIVPPASLNPNKKIQSKN